LFARSAYDFRTAIGSFVERNRDDITAISTLVVAVFTGTLWWVTWGMVKITKEQRVDLLRSVNAAESAAGAANLSASAAIGVELPRFLLSSAFMSHAENIPELLRNGNPSIYIKNHGRTAAEMLFYSAYLTVRAELPDEPQYPPPIQLNLGTIVASGGDFIIKDHNVYGGLSDESVELVMTKKSRLWLVGAISYRDFLGASHLTRFAVRGTSRNLTTS
jgi:hypothetical protein